MFAIYIEEYGYYEGKIYQNDNEFYPEAEIHSISEFTKIYCSSGRNKNPPALAVGSVKSLLHI